MSAAILKINANISTKNHPILMSSVHDAYLDLNNSFVKKYECF